MSETMFCPYCKLELKYIDIEEQDLLDTNVLYYCEDCEMPICFRAGEMINNWYESVSK